LNSYRRGLIFTKRKRSIT